MVVVEERLTVLEVKMEEVGTSLVRIERMLDGLYEIAQSLDVKAATLDQKVTALDEKFNRLDRRMEYSERRSDKLFFWVVGIQMTIFITLVAGLFGIVAKLI